MKKRLLSALLVLCMVLTMLPVSALAQDSQDAPEIQAAKLADTRENGIDSAYLVDDGYSAAAGEPADGVVPVTITATGLKLHQNGAAEPKLGFWVGFAIAAPDGVSKVTYAFGATKEDVENTENQITLNALEADVIDEKDGIAFYADAGDETPKTFAYVQWLDDAGESVGDPAVYEMNLAGVELSDTYAVDPAKLHDASGEIADDALYTVAPTAVADELADGVVPVTITATGLKEHENANGDKGRWIGFAIAAPEGAASLKYAFSADQDGLNTLKSNPLELGVTEAGKDGIAFYIDADDAKEWARVQWIDGEGKVMDDVIYHATLELTVEPEFEAPTVVPAILQDASGTIAAADLYEEDSYTVSAGEAVDGVIPVTVSIDGLKEHQNGLNTNGYWVGFALVAPEGATSMQIAFDTTKDGLSTLNSEALETNVAGGKDGVAFYADAGAETPKTWAKVQWMKGAEAFGEAATYHMNLDDVQIVLDDEAFAATLHDTSGAIADDQIYTAGSYGVVVTKTLGETYNEVAISAENVKPHANAETPPVVAAWVGFALVAHRDATGFKYAIGASDAELSDVNELEDITADQKGVAFYLKAPTSHGKYVQVEWQMGEGEPVLSVYKIDLSGVTVDETPVTIETVGLTEAPEGSTISVKVDNAGKKLSIYGIAAAQAATLPITYTTSAGGSFELQVALTYSEADGFVAEPATFTLLSSTYTVDCAELKALPEEVVLEAGAPDTQVGDKIASEDEQTVTAALETLTADPTELVASAASELVDIAGKLDVEALLAEANEEAAGTYDKIQVVAYLEVVATGYSADSKTLKLDITPKYRVEAISSENEGTEPKTLNDGAALETTTMGAPIEISITLPEGFAESTSPVYVKHLNANGSVKEWLIAALSEDEGKITATFEATSFSEYELAVDARSVPVTYNFYNETTQAVTYTPADIGTDLETDARSGYSFKGWATTEGATTAAFSGTLTDEVLTELVEALGESAALDLYPVFKRNSSTPPSGGGGGGGGGGIATYAITVEKADNGSVTASPTSASEDDTVTITVTPDKGYRLGELTALDKNDKALTLTNKGGGKYTFVMPASKVTVKATFLEGEALPFTDVNEDSWFYNAVSFVLQEGMMNGTADDTFSPNLNTTRGMIVTILYRLENEPAVSGNPFGDVETGKYYANAVVWAAANDIVNGYGEGIFGPEDNITREQLAAILYRYATSKGYDVSATGDLSAFADGATASDWATTALSWAVSNGIMNGKGDGVLDPTGNATRAEAAQMLMNFCKNITE